MFRSFRQNSQYANFSIQNPPDSFRTKLNINYDHSESITPGHSDAEVGHVLPVEFIVACDSYGASTSPESATDLKRVLKRKNLLHMLSRYREHNGGAALSYLVFVGKVTVNKFQLYDDKKRVTKQWDAFESSLLLIPLFCGRLSCPSLYKINYFDFIQKYICYLLKESNYYFFTSLKFFFKYNYQINK